MFYTRELTQNSKLDPLPREIFEHSIYISKGLFKFYSAIFLQQTQSHLHFTKWLVNIVCIQTK